MSKARTLSTFTSTGSPYDDGALDKSDVGLSNVDNTSDANKPVSTSVQSAIDNISQVFTATVTGSNATSDWTGSDPYVATITVSGILSTDTPIFDIDLSGVAFANVFSVEDDWALVYRAEASADNEIKLYATNEPFNDFDLIIRVNR